ncbi:MAG: aromatic-ring-hydroxylating dioxygenase subunit beta [Chloroflexi bacterium]|nr:aromatic-ring-hydroxylating dioxygenase subunit beta [Chloroflexota bacterium]
MAEVRPSRELVASVEEFLFLEAELLDDGRFDEWLELLAEDMTYRVPVRVTRERTATHVVSDEMFHMEETLTSLKMRIRRLKTDYAWAEDPPSRTRHFVSNIRVSGGPDRVDVRQNLLVYRNRGDDASHDLLSGERFDVLRRNGDGWLLASRRVVLDQVTLGTKNLGILL